MNNNNNFLIPFYKKIVLDFNIKDHADIGLDTIYINMWDIMRL